MLPRDSIDFGMQAAVLHHQSSIATKPLSVEDVERPAVGRSDLLVKVEACACCRTDLHVVEGDLSPLRLPVIPGHQVVGTVAAASEEAARFRIGDRVGIAWLRHVDGTCRFCLTGRENLCPNAEFTGYSRNGGYAEYAVVDQDFAYDLSSGLSAAEAAPLLCAGIIGFRALKRSGIRPGQRLGIFGFGSSAHITIQVALHWRCSVYVATRSPNHQRLAREMGAHWVGDSSDIPRDCLDAAVLFAPVGDLVPVALGALTRGGTLALAGIHMSDIPAMSYQDSLFYERTLNSVTNNTRQDGRELLALAAEIPIRTVVQTFPLSQVNDALQALKQDRVNGTAVIVM